MTKQDVANKIADRSTGEIPSEQAMAVINAFTSVVKEAVATGEPVFIRGFGTFKPVTRGQKKARNIARNEAIIIPAHQAPKFVPSKEFVEQVRDAVVVAE